MMKKRMNKVTALAIGAMMSINAAFMIAGTSTALATEVTTEEARQNALEAAGLSEDQVVVTKTASEFDEYGREVYEIVFLVPGQLKYEFDIDAETGKIIQNGTDLWDAEYGYEYQQQIDQKGMAIQTSGAEISGYQALTLAAADAGLQMKDIVVTRGGKGVDDGMMVYKMDFRGSEGVEYSYEVSSIDGSILSRKECQNKAAKKS